MAPKFRLCRSTSIFHAALAALCVLTLFGTAVAQEQVDGEQDQAATRIEVDEDASVIRFVIKGQERAVLDADGLHVSGDIDYSGTVTDGNRYSGSPTKKGRAK